MKRDFDPSSIVRSVPSHLIIPLLAAVEHGYAVNEAMLNSTPLAFEGMHYRNLRGNGRYALVDHAIKQASDQGLIPGTAEWFPLTDNDSGFYLLVRYQDLSITVKHATRDWELPERANHRLNKAIDNQRHLKLGFDDESSAEAANLVLLHGPHNLDFARFVMLGLDHRGHQIALAWSGNLIDSATGSGDGESFPVAPTDPIAPAPLESIAEHDLRLRPELDEKLEKTHDQ